MKKTFLYMTLYYDIFRPCFASQHQTFQGVYRGFDALA